MKLLMYMTRWQLSTIILYPCILLLSFSPLLAAICSNIVGALIFYNVDKFIFNRRDKKQNQ